MSWNDPLRIRLTSLPLLVLLLTLLVPVQRAVAHGLYYNSGSSISTSHPNWMRWIPDSTSLAALSLPGTHDTMANDTEWYVTGPERAWVLAQSLELRPQLNAGIRVLDIRARHYGDRFAIHHGAYYLMANFDDVLGTAVQFLQDNPSETILMRIKKEHTEENHTRSFKDTFEWYRNSPAYSNFIWRQTHIPTLGEVRGKIVILDDFADGHYGIPWSSLNKQDDWEQTDTNMKWTLVRNHLEACDVGDPNVMYVNFLSASGVGGTPSGIASSVNESALHYLVAGNVLRTGVMMMDFPGAGLIDAIIAHNFRMASHHTNIGHDFGTVFNNVSYGFHSEGDDEALDRFYEARGFLNHVIPGVYWHVMVSGTPGGDNWGYSVQYQGLYQKSDWSGGYNHVAFSTQSAQSAVSNSLLESYVQQQIGSLSGTAEQRAAQLAQRVRQRFPFQAWSVLVKRAPGGFDNWAYGPWGAHYMRWHGDYAYAVWGYAPQSGVYLYEHTGYEGEVHRLTASVHELRSRNFNDTVSSIRIIGNYQARLWEHDYWSGRSLSVPYSRDDLVGLGWNDLASSLEIWSY